MIDLKGAKVVEVLISEDGTTLWINTENGCQLRIQDINKIKVDVNGWFDWSLKAKKKKAHTFNFKEKKKR